MAQEFVIKSDAIETKINQLLPSQGGFQAGVDFSASTMVVPIVDLTETAEGSQVQESLQRALSLNRVTTFAAQNTTTINIITTPGYYQVDLVSTIAADTAERQNNLQITDGVTTKDVFQHIMRRGSNFISTVSKRITIFLAAGHSLQAFSDGLNGFLTGEVVQLAIVTGKLKLLPRRIMC